MVPTMTDDLRDRIAKVLHQRFGPSLGAAQCGWDREPEATRDMYRKDADAVIAELQTIRCWKCDNTVQVNDEADDDRYAWARPEEWKADDD